jgi:16S rRNA G966 N2-methylase RsmD
MKAEDSKPILKALSGLYSVPFPAARSGALYSAFSYPTKISPEAIAVFIATHTKPGDTVLDTFGGSGTTGIAAQLCANPSPAVIELARKLSAPVTWGPRNAIIYELSVIGSFVARLMCNPPNADLFLKAAGELIKTCEEQLKTVYASSDDIGEQGIIRHAIWSDILKCGNCGKETSFWDGAITIAPLNIAASFDCPQCGQKIETDVAERVYEQFQDPLTGQASIRRKRVLKRVYGKTSGRNWSRPATPEDEEIAARASSMPIPSSVPVVEIPWGDLHRSGYHKGITHAHHFYTSRNLLAMGTIWEQIKLAPEEMRDALKLLVLSYNATHATLMTRVVVKSGETDFVLTGAQTGVLYISSLPVEKNIVEGLRRKAKVLAAAFSTVGKGRSNVRVVCGDSTDLNLSDKSVDYVFTDPPFGDYIPYSEINYLNEIWLGDLTKKENEIIVSAAQDKSVTDYGSLMGKVFKEIARTLKDSGKATVVFHSAKANVWGALQEAYLNAGFNVELSSVLDKLQGSFKQVTSTVSVKGDPLLLLSKRKRSSQLGLFTNLEADEVIAELLKQAASSQDTKERTPERLYSRFVARYLERGLSVPMDAAGFYKIAKPLLEAR